MKRVALVAGATGALGQAICHTLHQAGMQVVCGYATAKETAHTLAAAIQGIPLQLTETTDLHSTVKDIAQRLGSLDVLVNAVGINLEGSAPGMPLEDWQRVLDTNLSFAFRLSQATLPTMLMQRYGRIVHLSSIAGRAGGRGQINYAVAKAGLQRMVQVLALEVARKGITVNAVAPGVIVSPMSERVCAEHGEELLAHIACRRFGKPEEVAAAVRFLASEEASYINGTTIAVDGGMML